MNPSPDADRALLAHLRDCLDRVFEHTNAEQGDRPHSWRSGHAWLWLGAAQAANGRGTQASDSFTQAVEQFEGSVDSGHPWLAEAREAGEAREAQEAQEAREAYKRLAATRARRPG